VSPIRNFLLNDCFWTLYDAGVSPEKTPLLTGFLDETSLSSVVSVRFEVSRDVADMEITAARSEVQL
jgi:hypothetical protein